MAKPVVESLPNRSGIIVESSVNSSRRQRLGPYSKRLERGAFGTGLDGRSPEGRFARQLEVELTAHIGGRPTITQRLLIDRTISIALKLEAFEAKIDSGNWTAHDSRTYAALNNAFRLALKALDAGRPPRAKAPSLAEVIARDRASKEG
jgi:hypothetical protein